jgi:hypothetical protein
MLTNKHRMPHENMTCHKACERQLFCGHACMKLCGDRCRCGKGCPTAPKSHFKDDFVSLDDLFATRDVGRAAVPRDSGLGSEETLSDLIQLSEDGKADREPSQPVPEETYHSPRPSTAAEAKNKSTDAGTYHAQMSDLVAAFERWNAKESDATMGQGDKSQEGTRLL